MSAQVVSVEGQLAGLSELEAEAQCLRDEAESLRDEVQELKRDRGTLEASVAEQKQMAADAVASSAADAAAVVVDLKAKLESVEAAHAAAEHRAKEYAAKA